MKKIFTAAFVLFSALSWSQQNRTNWMFNPYDEKVFVENAGQFVSLEKELHCSVLFSFEQGNTDFFLCANELIVRESEDKLIPNNGSEKEDPAEKQMSETEYSYFRFSFIGCNHAAISGEKKSGAVNKFYLPCEAGGGKQITAKSFSEVRYSNIYNGIDLVFSAHPQKGIKYFYLVAPGADINAIKTSYSGNGKLWKDYSGNVHAGKKGKEIIDRAPEIFYADSHEKISSGYIHYQNVFSFQTENYEHNKAIVIDPWVINPNFTDQNKAFDLGCDSLGNVYVCGGHNPWKVKKFTSTGNPVWTFSTPFFSWYGAFAVDPWGNTYVTDGCCSGAIIKLDSSGNVKWNVAYVNNEFWRLAFNCDYNTLYLSAGYATLPIPYQSVSMVDTGNGTISNSTVVFTGATSEPRSMALGLNGTLYSMSCVGNEIVAFTPSIANVFTVTSGYSLLYNGPPYANGSNSTSGENGIAGGFNFFCTSDGFKINKRDLSNGALISSTLIPGGVMEGNSGILIDHCDNIYVGSSNAVIKLDTTLAVVTSIPTSGAVYGLAKGINGELLACGDGFVGSFSLSVCPGNPCDSVLSNLPFVALASSDTSFCEKRCIDFYDLSTNNPTSWQWSFPGGSPSSSTLQNPDSICYNSYGTFDVELIACNSFGCDTLFVPAMITEYQTPNAPTVTQHGDTLFSSHGFSYAWYNTTNLNNVLSTDSFYIFTAAGGYLVIVTDSNGCSRASGVTQVEGVNENIFENGIVVSPNPADGKFTVSCLRFKVEMQLKISDVLGREIYKSQITPDVSGQKTEIDLKNVANGVYLMQLQSGNYVLSKKIIVQH